MKGVRVIMAGVWVLCALCAAALTRYSTVHNGFALLPHAAVLGAEQRLALSGDVLVAHNGSTRPMLVPDSTPLPHDGYRYMVRLANRHNKPGRAYAVVDSATQRRHSVSDTKCGLVFHRSADTYYMVTMRCANARLHDDIMDERTMTLAACRVHGDTVTTLATHTLGEGDDIDLHDGFNALQVVVSGGRATIRAGKHLLHDVMTIDVAAAPATALSAAVMVGSGCEVAIERTVASIDHDERLVQPTTWTVEALDTHFAASHDPLEGYWHYLDRDMNDKVLRLGGRYTLAIVATGDRCYDLIYVDGAEVLRSQWQPMMLKGRLTATQFSGTYEAMWIDATQRPIERDVQAVVDGGLILTLRFPVYGSQFRLAKSPRSGK